VLVVSLPHLRNSLKRRQISRRKRPTKVRRLLRELLRSQLKSQRRERSFQRRRVFRSLLEALKQRNKQVKLHPREFHQSQNKNRP
jgi:hypothetical protein